MAVHCCICVNQGKQTEYETVVNGYAVCADHMELVSQPGFDIMSLLLQRRERRAL
jgi:hypothetical protein